MKKAWLSIIGGIFSGLIISFLTLEYKGWTFIRHNRNGEVEQVINEMDLDLVTNSFLIIVASGIVIYITLTFIEKFMKKRT
ncbi:hypothetical protein [Bacillus sp. AK031]